MWCKNGDAGNPTIASIAPYGPELVPLWPHFCLTAPLWTKVLGAALLGVAFEHLAEVGVFAPGRFEVEHEVFDGKTQPIQRFLKRIDALAQLLMTFLRFFGQMFEFFAFANGQGGNFAHQFGQFRLENCLVHGALSLEISPFGRGDWFGFVIYKGSAKGTSACHSRELMAGKALALQEWADYRTYGHRLL